MTIDTTTPTVIRSSPTVSTTYRRSEVFKKFAGAAQKNWEISDLPRLGQGPGVLKPVPAEPIGLLDSVSTHKPNSKLKAIIPRLADLLPAFGLADCLKGVPFDLPLSLRRTFRFRGPLAGSLLQAFGQRLDSWRPPVEVGVTEGIVQSALDWLASCFESKSLRCSHKSLPWPNSIMSRRARSH